MKISQSHMASYAQAWHGVQSHSKHVKYDGTCSCKAGTAQEGLPAYHPLGLCQVRQAMLCRC